MRTVHAWMKCYLLLQDALSLSEVAATSSATALTLKALGTDKGIKRTQDESSVGRMGRLYLSILVMFFFPKVDIISLSLLQTFSLLFRGCSCHPWMDNTKTGTGTLVSKNCSTLKLQEVLMQTAVSGSQYFWYSGVGFLRNSCCWFSFLVVLGIRIENLSGEDSCGWYIIHW